MSYARRWHLAEVLGTDHLLLRAAAPGIPLVVFDVSNEGNVNDAFVAVVRALEKLPRDAGNLDRAHAVLAALGIVYESDGHEWDEHGVKCVKCGVSRNAAERFGWVKCYHEQRRAA